MRALFFGSLISFLIFSCNQPTGFSKSEIQENVVVKGLDDPDQFIGQKKTKVTVLGIFHFDSPGLDNYKQKFSVDILSKGRQAEIKDLIKSLSEFNPTKILVEVPRKESDSLLNDRYQKYVIGQYNISDKKNEIYQLGFRLAKKLDHHKIYASDAKGSRWFGAEIDWKNYDSAEYQKSLDQYKKTHRYNYEKVYELQDSLKSVNTLKEYFKLLNNPKSRLKSHQAYLTNTVLTGAGDLYIGADIVARWYQRNLKIFANIYDISDFSKEERVLLIYGAGHVWQLRQHLKDSPDFEYVEINEYL